MDFWNRSIRKRLLTEFPETHTDVSDDSTNVPAAEKFNIRLMAPMMVAALYVAAHQYADVNPYALLLISMGVLIAAALRRWWPIISVWGDNIRVLALGSLSFVAALWLIWPEGSLY